jgi:hypothetical protein
VGRSLNEHRHRAAHETRTIPPELVKLRRVHVRTYGTTPDGRIFQTARGGIIRAARQAATACSHGVGTAFCQEAGGGLMVAGRVAGDDRDLAAVEEAVADAVVVLDVLEGVAPPWARVRVPSARSTVHAHRTMSRWSSGVRVRWLKSMMVPSRSAVVWYRTAVNSVSIRW